MKILSNFDTTLPETLEKEYESMFGKDKVIVIRKSKLYFYKYLGGPLMVFGILLIGGIYSLYVVLDSVAVEWELAFWTVILMYILALLTQISGRWVSYKMDFLMVTPKEVIKYDQWGVFSRSTEKIHADKIKSMSIEKHWFIQSLLDIGEIHFLADSVSSAATTTFYVYFNNPDATMPAATDPYGSQAVWAGYEAVYHFVDVASTPDETGNGDRHNACG